LKYFGVLLAGLVAVAGLTASVPCQAQFSSPTMITVQMIDPVDSSRDQPGKTYRATVTSAANPGQGVTIANGSQATLTLTSASSLNLTSLVVNGQPTTVSGSIVGVASVTDKMSQYGLPSFKKPTRIVQTAGSTVRFSLSQPLTNNAVVRASQTTPVSNSAAPAATPAATPASTAPAGTTPAATPAASTTTGATYSGGYITYGTRLYTPTNCSHNGDLAVCAFSVINRGNDVTVAAGGGGGGELANIQFIDDAHVPHGPAGKYFIDKYGTRQANMVLTSGQNATFYVEFPNVNPGVQRGDFQFGNQHLTGIPVQGAPTQSAQ
jgi:hypothetical protein